MNKFLENTNFQVCHKKWNTPIFGKKIKSVAKNLYTKKISDSYSITGKFFQTFKEEKEKLYQSQMTSFRK